MFLFICTSPDPHLADHCFFAVAFSKEALSEEMNFSLYRGNLHKVPDVPRRWPLSKPSMSLQVFQKAIAKRREAVHRLQKNRKCQGQLVSDALANGELGQEHCEGEAVDGMDYSGDKASSHDEDGAKDGEDHGRKRKREDSEALGMETEGDDIKAEEDLCRVRERKPRISSETDTMIVEGMPMDALDDMDCDYASQPHRMSDTRGEEGVILQAEDADVTHGLGDAKGVESGTATEESNKEKEAERLEAPRTPAAKDEECIKPTERVTAGLDGCATPCVLTTQESSGGTCKAKRKAELEEKLKQLQETKHQLVQILKQVLISEEESKRKGQGLSQYPAAYSTVGTMDQPLDQRTGSDLHISADLEEGELEYTRNPGQPIVASSHSSDFSIAHPPPMGATLGRHYNNSQQLNKL